MVIALMEGDYGWGIYHAVNESSDERRGVSWYDFAKKIFELSNKEIKLDTMTTEELNRAATRPAYSILLNTKYPKMRSWEEALEDYLNKYHS
jgi:dTDP-4-dehydrorhamnose reductase